MSARYFYLQIDLIGSKVEPLEVRQTLQTACGEVFGECGSALPLDVLTVQDSPTAPNMSISRLESGPGGKDVVLVAARELLAEPPRVALPEPEPAPGLILPDGSINWGCPCLGGMATGPCAVPFRDAFSCFHYSEAEPKGSDCYEKFSEMQACMADYPELYGRDEDDDEPGLPAAGPGSGPEPDGTDLPAAGPDGTDLPAAGPDGTDLPAAGPDKDPAKP